jgi:hypothetical protein
VISFVLLWSYFCVCQWLILSDTDFILVSTNQSGPNGVIVVCSTRVLSWIFNSAEHNAYERDIDFKLTPTANQIVVRLFLNKREQQHKGISFLYILVRTNYLSRSS